MKRGFSCLSGALTATIQSSVEAAIGCGADCWSGCQIALADAGAGRVKIGAEQMRA